MIPSMTVIRAACYVAALFRLTRKRQALTQEEEQQAKEQVSRILAIANSDELFREIWREEYQRAITDLDMLPPW